MLLMTITNQAASKKYAEAKLIEIEAAMKKAKDAAMVAEAGRWPPKIVEPPVLFHFLFIRI